MGILHTVFDLITALCGYVFQNNLTTRERIVKYPTNKDTYAFKRSAVDLSNIFSDFLYKSICCGYMFELPRYVYKSIYSCYWYTHLNCLNKWVPMFNIRFYKEADKNTRL